MDVDGDVDVDVGDGDRDRDRAYPHELHEQRGNGQQTDFFHLFAHKPTGPTKGQRGLMR